MESSESHEPSYYEVALTNRQVLIAFVVLLTSIVAAFLSGVWIGRGGSSPARPTAGISEAAAAPAEPPLEQLTFFNGKEPGARTAAGAATSATAPGSAAVRPPAAAGASAAAPATDEVAAEERATEEMRQNLDATMAANRTAPAVPAGGASPPPAGTRVTAQAAPTAGAAPAKPAPAPAKPAATGTVPVKEAAAKPAAAKPAATGKIFVQVYSSNNAGRAKEIVAQLRKAGFAVVVAEIPKGGGTNHRVRVGPYAERAKADAAATKLRREFRLETWVTDSP